MSFGIACAVNYHNSWIAKRSAERRSLHCTLTSYRSSAYSALAWAGTGCPRHAGPFRARPITPRRTLQLAGHFSARFLYRFNGISPCVHLRNRLCHIPIFGIKPWCNPVERQDRSRRISFQFSARLQDQLSVLCTATDTRHIDFTAFLYGKRV